MLINGLAARSRIAGSDFDAPLLAVKMGIISQYFSAKPPEHAMLPEGPCVLCTIPAIFGLSGRNAFIKGFPASQERGTYLPLRKGGTYLLLPLASGESFVL